jgi:hypothetical protein
MTGPVLNCLSIDQVIHDIFLERIYFGHEFTIARAIHFTHASSLFKLETSKTPATEGLK